MDFTSDEIRRAPFATYDALRERSPVLHEPRLGAWLVFDFDSVKRVLTEHDEFSSAASPRGTQSAEWLIFQDAPRHGRLRALIAKAFTPRVIEALEPRVRQLCAELVARLPPDDELELCEHFSVPFPMMVIAELLGAPASDWSSFRRWAETLMNLSATLQGGALGEQAVAAALAQKVEIEAYVRALVDDRRRAPREDLMSRLVKAEVDDRRLTDAELLAFFQLLLIAGSETTTNLLNNIVIALSENEEAERTLRDRPELLPVAIEEVLRHRSPLQATFRRTRAEVLLHGQRLPAGALVLAMIGSANRDPRHFAHPERFDILRTPNPHIAFGHGVHFCLGAPLSRLEARIGLAALLEVLPRFSLQRPDWQPRRAFHVHGPERLYLQRRDV
jgi:cytochrome P450